MRVIAQRNSCFSVTVMVMIILFFIGWMEFLIFSEISPINIFFFGNQSSENTYIHMSYSGGLPSMPFVWPTISSDGRRDISFLKGEEKSVGC